MLHWLALYTRRCLHIVVILSSFMGVDTVLIVFAKNGSNTTFHISQKIWEAQKCKEKDIDYLSSIEVICLIFSFTGV